MDWLFYSVEMLLLGAGVGLLSAALGLGGGILMVPAFMTFIAGMDEHTAKGSSLFIIIFVALLNAWRHNRGRDDIPWALAAVLAVGSVSGGFAGAWVTARLEASTVIAIFLVFIMAVGLRTFFIEPRHVDESAVRRRTPLALLIGLVAGLAGGATGTGGGAVLIPLALMTGIASNMRVVGLSNMVMVATSIAGTVAHLQAEAIFQGPYTVGHVEFSMAPLVFLGAQLGSLPGKRINALLTLPRRRVVMGVLLLLVSARMAWGLWAQG
jgi:uncharacterized membrane protein YfcA